MSIVVDTNVWIAYDNKDDEQHAQAVEVMRRIEAGEFGSVILSDYVFSEVVTLLGSREEKSIAVSLGKRLLAIGNIVNYVDNSLFKVAWEIFQKSTNLSFTDCLLVVLAREKHAAIATFDGHFVQFKDLRIIS